MHRYTDIVHWWDKYVKRMIKTIFIREGTEKNTDRTQMENLYYAAVHEVLRVSYATVLRPLGKMVLKL